MCKLAMHNHKTVSIKQLIFDNNDYCVCDLPYKTIRYFKIYFQPIVIAY